MMGREIIRIVVKQRNIIILIAAEEIGEGFWNISG